MVSHLIKIYERVIDADQFNPESSCVQGFCRSDDNYMDQQVTVKYMVVMFLL